MNQIVSVIKQEIIKRSNAFEEQTKGTKDEYNLYEKHVKYVYRYVLKLSKDKNVDREVLEISALLHDIAMTDINLKRENHNVDGAIIANQLLQELEYPDDKRELVRLCILNHSNKRKDFRTTEEEQILVDADGLSHFDDIASLYSLAHDVMNLSDKESLKFIQNKLTKDYNEISANLKYLINDKYQNIMNAKDIEEIL
ncbi:MAG: HD domain-containing protein [Bacilli bacterium]|nr:HD domain-containing protein [Bacilli bacterium]